MKNYLVRNLSLIILIILFFSALIVGYFYFNYDKDIEIIERQNISTDSTSPNRLLTNKNSANQIKNSKKNEKLGSILGGLCAGLFVATIQHLIAIDERRKLDLIKALNVRKVLFNRSDEDYYRGIISNAKNEIKIMGVTASRFINDFANTSSTSANNKILIKVLNENVKVCILIPNKMYLKDANNKEAFDRTQEQMKILKNQFSHTFDYRYFDHEPAHSIFLVDGDSIIGPVIPGLNSKETPAIQISNSSPFAKVYLRYFQNEWNEAKPQP